MHHSINCIRRGNRLTPRAFTLVELLVVIGIIAVLIGLLVPSLSRARESANRAKCLANLRAIGQAIALYANDFKDRVPNNNPKGTALDYDGIDKTLVAFYNAYLEPPAILYCPSDSDPAPTEIVTGDGTLPNSARCSYDFYSIYWMPEYGPFMTKLKVAPLVWDWNGGMNKRDRDQNHGTAGGNVLFSDGHAAWVDQKDWDGPNWPQMARKNYRP